MSSECGKLRDAINQVSAFSIPDAIPHRVGNKIQAKNPQRRCEGVPGNETSGGEEILSGLGIHCDRDRGGSRAHAHGDSAKICGQQSDRNAEKEYEPTLKPEVSFPESSLLGQGRDMVERIFRLDGRDQRSGHQEIC